MGGQATLETVLSAVARQMGQGTEDLTPETVLGPEGLGIDSIGLLELLLGIEAETGLPLRSETLTADALATIGHLAAYLDGLAHD
ncbi:hypothetical protein GCM10011452_30200 [Gemmobacter lanyuensis]|uniref:Carrier domain-containing protein n=1 Tax=Gemmobacter lanyuensis TaxID=1054497 RepID=A0A918IZQ9_9RHOB|nr:phosphopantetheine-binding protein [Gemmobacter lanyuensis]GGW39795.1 hypothetical protein GCM10011452_30200 [Gemmobacter lanyuensis]